MSRTIAIAGEALLDRVFSASGELVAEVPGGSPMNVAVGLARLGHDVSLATQVGSDHAGEILEQHLTGSGVRLMPQSRHGGSTSVATATLTDEGTARFAVDITWDVERVEPGPYLHLHVGSLAVVLEPGASTLVEAVVRERQAGASISYDPNVRPALMGDPKTALSTVERMVELSDIVKASHEDVLWLYPDHTLEWVEDRWRDLGATMVIITLAERGARVRVGSHRREFPAEKCAVVDTIGAGDAFMAGLLHALSNQDLLGTAGVSSWKTLDEGDLGNLLAPALQCAALTVSRQGANPPFLSEVRPT